jgi:hypothetical protein
MAFSFKDLNLSGVEAASAGSVLKPGRHVVTVAEAQIKTSRSNGAILELKLTNQEGAIRHWINVHVPNSEQATRIGREQLKALLVHGGHPNPDNPGGVEKIRGLTVGVSVGSDTYTDKDGNERTGSKVKGFFDPSEVTGKSNKQAPSSSQGGGDGFDDMKDDIPF